MLAYHSVLLATDDCVMSLNVGTQAIWLHNILCCFAADACVKCLTVVLPSMQSALSCVDVLASFAAFSQSQMGATCRPVLLPPGNKHHTVFFISFIFCLTVWGVEPDVTLSDTHGTTNLVSSNTLEQCLCQVDIWSD